jgi:hypothetical protein
VHTDVGSQAAGPILVNPNAIDFAPPE